MKKGWKIALKIVDALIWIYQKIRGEKDKDYKPGESPLK